MRYTNLDMPKDAVAAKFKVDLKPCPFCECPYVHLVLGELPHITCDQCGADGPVDERRDERDREARQYNAINAWNKRWESKE